MMNGPLRISQFGLRAINQSSSITPFPPTVRVIGLVRGGTLTAQSNRQYSCWSFCIDQNGSLPARHTAPFRPEASRMKVSSNTSFIPLAFLRNASTTASSTTTSSTTARPSQSSPELDWPTFFRLRKSRRRLSLLFSISTAAVTASSAGYAVTATPLSETITSMSPLPDPFMTLILSVLISGAMGWLIGPVFGIGLWRLVNRSQTPGFMIRERDFYERVKKYRVDPRGGSAQNPVPDYYGEKVGSRDEWRTWLKDQRAFNRKREGRGAHVGGGLGFTGKGISK